MIYINQSIYLAAHLSISSRQKKVFIASSSFLMPADAAPLNERRLLQLFLSSLPLSKKNLFVANVSLLCVIPPCCLASNFFHIVVWSPNYCGVVALAVFFLVLVVVLSFEVFHIIIVVIVVEVECVWMLLDVVVYRLTAGPTVHLLLSFFLLQGFSKRALPPRSPAGRRRSSYSCGGAAAASAAASSPSPAVSEVQSVRLSRSSCMIRVLSL